jgi:hypothetical protein
MSFFKNSKRKDAEPAEDKTAQRRIKQKTRNRRKERPVCLFQTLESNSINGHYACQGLAVFICSAQLEYGSGKRRKP